MKVAWLAVALLLPLVSGCLDSLGETEPDRPVAPVDVGYDPQEVTITGVEIIETTIASDDVELDTLVYVPLTTDAPNGDAVQWPVVVLLHGWGFPKEMYTNMPQSGPAPTSSLPNADVMQQFAEVGLLTVAYDARGWFQSTGTSSIAGLAEMNDLRNVIDYVNENFDTSGRVGLAGASYGGGQSLLGWRDFDDVLTAVPHQPWVDLYEGLAPGNALKSEWTVFLGAVTAPGTKGQGFPPKLTEWTPTLITRSDAAASDAVRAAMDTRSILDDAASVDKPIFLCQGLQETLFPQIHDVWQVAPGFTRAHYYQGGHGVMDQACWDKTKQWFQFFLGGHDTGVDSWAKVVSVDHNGEAGLIEYSDSRVVEIDSRQFYLHGEQMVESSNPNRTFMVEQRVIANPIGEPQAAWDVIGRPNEAVPAGMRQDPTATFFTSAAMGQSETLLGAPQVTLQLAENATPFQVVATIFHESGSNWRMLGRTATSPLANHHLDDGTVTLELPWMKADLAVGDRLVLKLGGNDEGAFFPLPANYAVEFSGESTIHLPFFAPTGMSS